MFDRVLNKRLHWQNFLSHIFSLSTFQNPISYVKYVQRNQMTHTAWKVSKYGVVWSVFSRIRTEYGEIQSISPYSVRMRENTDQKKLRILTHFTQRHPSKAFQQLHQNSFTDQINLCHKDQKKADHKTKLIYHYHWL